jgi:membrane glycosyltransferase
MGACLIGRGRSATMTRMWMRRFLVALIIAGIAVGLTWLMAWVLGAGGWSGPKFFLLVCFAGTAPWTGLCVANAVVGFLVRMLAREPARFVFGVEDSLPLPAPPPATVIAVTVRNEDLFDVLPPLRRLLEGLDASGHGDSFALFILSDTGAGDEAVAEEAAVAAFRAGEKNPGRILYRRRAENAGFKAGNVMDFLEHHATGFALMVTLDADSEMSAFAVLRLVRAMMADERLAIAQHLTVGRPAAAALSRLFQFGMRAGMRVWATGQGWWQGDAGPYWGHNAVVRITPFKQYCRLPKLPDGSEILSHDQMEAALLAGAGWAVRVLPDEAGSSEANPPALPEFLARDARWLAGNLQYLHMLRLPGLASMGRWQLVQAILLFAGAPLYTVFLLVAAIEAARGGSVPVGPASSVTLLWLGFLYAPKLLGYAEVSLKPAERARYGGGGRFLLGACVEFFFTLFLDAIGTVNKTLVMIRLVLGAGGGWAPQNRAARSVGWAEATHMLWPHTLVGLFSFAGFALGGWVPVLWAVPLAGGLLVAIPLCVFTADPRFGAWLRAKKIAAIPEELFSG